MVATSLIRYPGSKAKIYKQICSRLPPSATSPLFFNSEWDAYCEPFFGSGALGFQILDAIYGRIPHVIVNDIDPGIFALWYTIQKEPLSLDKHVANFTPSVEKFFEFKSLDGKPQGDLAYQGFRKLALHQMSVSGYGVKSGGPIGGREQRSDYNVDCRWRPDTIRRKIRWFHRDMKRFKSFQILNDDFGVILKRLSPRTLVYLDPPYFKKGWMLYKHGMSDVSDHQRLASILRDAKFTWVLSYDDVPEIREMYSFATIHEFKMTPINQTVRRINDLAQVRRKNSEIVICSGNW